MNGKEFIQLLRDEQGEESQREFAGRIGISPQYLNDVLQGNREPGEGLLRPMGVKKVVSYEKEGPYTKEESIVEVKPTYAELGKKLTQKPITPKATELSGKPQRDSEPSDLQIDTSDEYNQP